MSDDLNNTLIEEVKKRRRSYAKQYYEKNKDIIKDKLKNRYETDPEFRKKRQEASNKYHVKNKMTIKFDTK